MADKIHIEITTRETIKPCSPTPQHLRTVNLSYLDQIALDVYVPIILFYPFTTNITASERARRLKETLSKTLTAPFYYPLAGRLRNNQLIECNDEGAEFVMAKAPFSMSEILENPNFGTLSKLLAAGAESRLDSAGGCLLIVQITVFECGGVSIGALFSHKIADACSISGFVRTWASTSRDENEGLVSEPEFGSACVAFPPILDSSFTRMTLLAPTEEKYVARRFVFTGEKIAALKSKVSADQVRNPTRVEVVSGLLWKCLIKSSASKSTSYLSQIMNLRKRIVPPLGSNAVGNLIWVFTAESHEKEGIDLQVLVGKFRRGLEKQVENYANEDYDIGGVIRRQLGGFLKTKRPNEIDVCSCSSWCRFGFYEADFGWGKPAWVSIVSSEFKNSIVMMDTSDGGGIEAWLLFEEQRMVSIENDQELLAYASLNPSVI